MNTEHVKRGNGGVEGRGLGIQGRPVSCPGFFFFKAVEEGNVYIHAGESVQG